MGKLAIKPGQVVMISAGAAGIGRVIAETFLAHDCQVHVCDIDETAISEFLTANAEASATTADISDVTQVDRVFEDLQSKYGQLDVLVNNAGIAGPTAHVEDVHPDEWDQTIAVGLNAQFYCARKAIPLLKASRGSIISIASSVVFTGCPGRAPYTAAKWAVIGLVKTLAMELGPDGVRVNAICPGSVAGERLDAVIERDAKKRGLTVNAIRDVYLRQSSLRTFIEPEDVANLALFLASDLANKISGQALGLDGHTETLANWMD
jgi:NAD(P)-dependent dehydrogenase (short-subunit alcohol dehydrogenase family)